MIPSDPDINSVITIKDQYTGGGVSGNWCPSSSSRFTMMAILVDVVFVVLL